ncbi:MAG TPA: Ada metal-binding domain-containing protein, partial [Vicinamibacteria bacterium]|nr:Ada metal-binding domain-containing protein [Vicinamibacteria bacterium]
MLMMRTWSKGAAETDGTSEESARWQAVLDRDRKSDGRFVFAVRSTGIYCRPSCPARRPRRDRVAFFEVPEAAERAGFRACRRCRPGDAGAVDPQAALERRACRLLHEDGEEAWRLPALARAAGASPRHLLRAFRRFLGVTPRQYAHARRLAA